MSSRFRACWLVTVLLAVGSFGLLATAQTVVNGDISGTVTDSAGAVVSNADVNLTSLADGRSQTTTTNATGLYRFSFLKPGTYKLTVGEKGFKSVTETVSVSVGQVATVNAKLEVGAASEVVEVTGAAPLIQTENGDTTTTFEETQLK